MRPRPALSSAVAGLTEATAWIQPVSRAERHVDGRHEQDQERRHLHHRPGLDRAEAHGDPDGEQGRRDVDQQREAVETEQVDRPAADLHARQQRDGRDDQPRDDDAHGRGHRVPDDQRPPVGRGEHQAPGEAGLVVAGHREAGEHAAERGRLEQHEDELECRIAGREVEARDAGDPRKAAGERGEEEEREDQRRHAAAPGCGRRCAACATPRRAPRRESWPGSCAHQPRLERRARARPARPRSPRAATPNPSARASPSQPVTSSERIPSIR